MKDMFNKRQRFSLRKYSFGVASVLLGVAVFSSAQTAKADEVTTSAEATVAATAANSEASPTSTSTVVSEAANTTVETVAESTVATAVASEVATSEASSTAPTSTSVAPTSETTAAVVNAAEEVANRRGTQGYAANAVETPTTASMPRREGYVAATTGSSLLAADSAAGTTADVATAGKHDASDPMPGDDQLTDTTQFGKSNDPELKDFTPVYEEALKDGNALTPYALTGENEAFNTNDETKRVAQVWSVQDAAGNPNANYLSFVFDVTTGQYEAWLYDASKNLLSKNAVAKTAGQEYRLALAGNQAGDENSKAYVALQFDGKAYFAVYNGTDGQTYSGRPADKSAIRYVYSSLVGTTVPNSYRRIDQNPSPSEQNQIYTQVTQSLPGGAEIGVNYLEVGTNKQMRDSDKLIGFVGDKYTTTAATDSEFYAELQNKGYELVTEKNPKYPNGEIRGTYWGGKGFVAVRDVSNQGGFDIRVRMTVINDAGDVVFEAWNKSDGTKLPIRYYKEGTNPLAGDALEDQMVGNTLKEFNYVSDPIRPANFPDQSSAKYGSFAFRIYTKDGMWISTNMNLSAEDRAKAGAGFDSGWSNGWRPSATDVTYWYARPKGNVNVEYYIKDTDTKLQDDVKVYGTEGESVKETYNTATDTLRPATITKDGKTYRLVESNGTPELKSGSDAETGTVEKTEKTVKYQYEEVKKGNVVVEYYDTKGNVIKDPVEDTPESDEGTDYDTKDHKDDKITKDGKTYFYKEIKNDSDPETGKVKEGQTTVKYVYEEAGNVNINYIATDGTVIKAPVKDTVNAEAGTAYDATENDEKPATIDFNGKTYRLVTVAGNTTDGHSYDANGVANGTNDAPATGTVESGVTKEVTYVYEEVKKDDKAVIIFRHVNADGTVVVKELERTSEFDGKEGDAIQYTEAEKQAVIDKYRAQGFRVVADQYGTGKNYDGKDGVDTYYIDLTPYIVPVTPDKPLTPGGEVPTDPNSPKDPDPNDPKFPNPDEPTHPKDPKYPNPDNPDITKLTEEVNRVITYYAVINGVKTAIPTVVPTQTDTVNFERKGTVNLVTGETTLENWNPQTGTFNTVTPATTITIDGVEYTTSTVVNGETVNPTDDDKAYEVVYTPVTPEKKDDKAVIIFRHVNADGTVVVKELERTSEFDGKEGDAIQYTEAEKQAVIDKYRAQGFRVVADQYGTGKNYDGKDGVDTYYIDLTPYIVPVTPDKPLTPGGEVPTDPNSPEDPDPNDPKFPNPNVPTHPKDPKYPNPDNDEILKLTEDVNRTITYYAEINGVKTPIAEHIATQKDTVNFERKGTVNLVTGETTLGDWTSAKDNFDTVTPQTTVTINGVEYTISTVAKVVDGTANVLEGKEAVDGETVAATDADLFYEVVYTPVATPEVKKGSVTVEYIEVDANGNKVRNLQTTSDVVRDAEVGTNYTTRQKAFAGYDFVQVSPTSAPANGTVTEGTQHVVYEYRAKAVTPVAKDDTARVIYQHTDKSGNVVVSELERTSDFTGKEGEDVNYSTEDTIKKYQKLGYELVSNGFDNDGTKPKYDGQDGTQEFVVKLTPIIVPITPEKPLVPGKEIPELPETPKYPDPKDPDGKTKEELYKLTEEVKRTVTYYTEDKDGNNRTPIAESEIPTKSDTLNFRREGSINLVTGETTLGDWKLVEAGKDYTAAGEETGLFSDYNNPVKEGYLVVKEEVAGVASEDSDAIKATGAHTDVKATDGDIEDKVIYRPIAKYVPKFPPGETPEDPWNEVPYTNDPNDPTKITPPTDPKQPPIPYVPGMEPKDPGTNEPLKPVDPEDPKKGYIPPTPTTPFEDTEIPYEVVKGSVIVRHVIEGTETDLKDPETVKDNVKVGETYTTAGESEIVKDGKTYVLVGYRANSDATSGDVEKGTKTVVYEYKLKEDTPVTPEKKDDKAVIIFRHVNADGTVVVKELERTSEFDGKEGDAIQYTEAEKQAVIDKYRAQGFRVVADQYGTGKNYDGQDGVDTYYIDLTPYIVPVTPDKPLTPGGEVPTDPNSPKDPDPNDPKFPNPDEPTHPKDPKYPNPDNPDITKLTEEVNRVITYYAVINGVKTAIPTVVPTQTDTVNFERKGTVNLVTGETTLENWNPQTGTFNTVTPATTITIDGVEYTTSTVVNGETVNPTDDDKAYEVVYTPVATPEVKKGSVTVEYIEVDANGNKVRNLQTTSDVVRDAEVGTDYTTRQKSFAGYDFVRVNPTSAPANGTVTEGTQHVVYEYRAKAVTPVAKDDTARVIYQHTDKSGNVVVSELERTSDFTGKEGEDVNYSTEDTIKKYQKLGYELVSNGFDNDGTKPKYDGQDGTQEFVVKLTPIIVPITPEKPLVPGKEIPELPETPKYPDPKDPDGKTKEDLYKLTEEVKRTVTYYTENKDGSNRQPVSESDIPTKTDTLNFRREGSINLVTGETTLGDWKLVETGKDYTTAGEETGSFADYANDKVLPGYILSKEEVDRGESTSVGATGAHTGVKATDADYNDKVIYIPISNYVPVVPRDPQDPNSPDPKFPEDPWGPDKPNVPYTNDPQDPGKIVPPTDPSQPPIPYVPGYTPKDPKGNPLKPVDPTDPTKGYEPPVPEDPTEPTPIPYERDVDPTPEKKDDKAVIIFRHVNADGTVVVSELERTSEFDGKEGDAIQYTEAEKQAVIDKYRAQGFRVVADQYGAGKNYDGKDGVDTYYIDLTPYIVPVTPDKPLTPGGEVPTDPNSPKDPDPENPLFPNPDEPTHPKDPKYPDPKDPDGGKADDMYKLTEEVNRTITYYAIINGVKTPIANVIPTSKDTLNFQRKGTINLVTGETTLENWNPQTGTFNTVTPATTITIDGVEYTTSTVVNGETVNPTDDDKFYEVVYTPVEKPEAPKGNVIVKYVKEDGTPIKEDREDTPNSPVGTDYDTNEPGENPTRITQDGKTYELVRVDGNEKGKVVEGTTTVTYVYREVTTPTPETPKGNVIVKYVIKGTDTEISNPRTDTPNSPVGTDYNTNEPGENPTTITKDGKTYRLVGRQETSSPETGKVVEGTTVVVYEYEEVVTPTPDPEPQPEPKPEPKPEPDPEPTPDPEPNKPTPPTPEKPVEPNKPTPPTPGKPVVPTEVTPGNPTPQTPASPATPANELPQTGEDSSQAAAVAGVGILGSLLVGLGLSRKKKED